MIEKIENEILCALKNNFENYEVDSFPVDFEKYVFTSPKGCLLLRYDKTKFSAQNTLCAVNSDGTYNFTLFLGLRYLQKHNESYDTIKRLSSILNGLPVLGKRLVLNDISFEDEIAGDLFYAFGLSICLPQEDVIEDLSQASKAWIASIEEMERTA